MAVAQPDWLNNQTSPMIRSGSVSSYVDVGRKKALTFDETQFTFDVDEIGNQNVVHLSVSGSLPLYGANLSTTASVGALKLPPSASAYLTVNINGVDYKVALFPV